MRAAASSCCGFAAIPPVRPSVLSDVCLPIASWHRMPVSAALGGRRCASLPRRQPSPLTHPVHSNALHRRSEAQSGQERTAAVCLGCAICGMMFAKYASTRSESLCCPATDAGLWPSCRIRCPLATWPRRAATPPLRPSPRTGSGAEAVRPRQPALPSLASQCARWYSPSTRLGL